MKNVIAVIISCFVLVFSIFFVILPKEKFSENENRYLEEVPYLSVDNILSHEFQEGLTNYISDHFPLREEFLYLNTKKNLFSGIYRNNGVYYGEDYLLEEYSVPSNVEKISRIINKFVDKNNVDTSFILSPTSIMVNSDKLPKYNISYDENIVIDEYKKLLNVKFIDIRDTLLEHKNEYLFYRTDHHWTTLGSYYAYLEYCKENGIEPKEFNFEIVNYNFYGTLYSKVLDKSLEMDYILRVSNSNNKELDNILYDYSYLRKKDKYSFFLGGNKNLVTITNQDGIDDLLVIKDSYANCFIPFIAENYKNIYVIDPRSYNDSISEFIKDNNIKKVLFIYNILTIDDDLGILGINS